MAEQLGNVTLTVGTQVFAGWKSIDIQRGVEIASGGFDITSADLKGANALQRLKPDSACSVQLDGKTVLTGAISEVQAEHSKDNHSITVRGRDAAGDLVDCSAIFKTGTWADSGMVQIANDLCQPFGVKVTSDVDVSKKFPVWNIEPGETVFENIERMARAHGVLVISDGLGGLKITRPGKKALKTALSLGENILSASVALSHAQRFSKYILLTQRNRDDANAGEVATELEGIALDPEVKRHRPIIELYEDSFADLETLLKRAQWRRNVNAGRAQRATISVQGWSHAEGVWSPNQLVPVRHSPLGLNNVQLLIAHVRSVLDNEGTRSELTLTPAKAYEPDEQPGDIFL